MQDLRSGVTDRAGVTRFGPEVLAVSGAGGV